MLTKHLPSPVIFREDINGLRAWAVMAVLFFHFSIFDISGGFVGVDIFFVISGFLMTSIIVRGFEKNNFSISYFYMARIRRILPALLVLIAVLIIMGWFLLQTLDYKTLGTQSVYAITFLSNIYYLNTTGYFDPIAEEKWLLHTWSLAVEAQFYILFPILISFLWRFKPGLKPLSIVLFLLLIGLFITNLIVTNWWPTAAFYLLPTRGWELLAGGLVYLISRQASFSSLVLTISYWLGWGLILFSFLWIEESMKWPSYWAILPVFGTSLVIFAHNSKCVFTNNLLAQWIGDRSYSLYLWHWPIVVALYFSGMHDKITYVLAGILLSLVLAHISYFFIESPTRKFLSKKGRLKEFIIITIASFFIGIIAVFININTYNNRFPESVNIAFSESWNKDPRKKECIESSNETGSTKCIYGDDNIGAFLIGDSHSGAIVSGLGESAKQFGKGVLFWGMHGCPTLDGFMYNKDYYKVNVPENYCSQFNLKGFEYLKTLDSSIPIISFSRFSSYLKGPNEVGQEEEAKYATYYFNEKFKNRNNPLLVKEYLDSLTTTACRIQEKRQVYLVRPLPEMRVNVPKTLSRNILFKGKIEDIKIPIKEYYKRHKLVWQAQDLAAKQCSVKILNPLPYLCDSEYCYGSKNGRPLYYDDDHMSEYGNKLLIPMFSEVFTTQSK